MKIKEFFNSEKDRLWKGRHLKDVTYQVNRFLQFNSSGDRDIASFKPKDIHAFQDHLLAEGLAESSVNRYTAGLSALFNHAVDEELIDHAPKFKWRDEGKRNRVRYFTDQECQDLVAFFQDHEHSWMAHFVTIGLNTGMRRGEIIEIGDANKVVFTKGRYWVYLADTKNGDERYVPLNDNAKNAIDALGGRVKDHFSHRKFYNAWAEARDAIAKGDKEFVFHVCRHTCATRLANDLNTQTVLIGKLLGHRSESTTKKYIKSKDDTLLGIADALGAIA